MATVKKITSADFVLPSTPSAQNAAATPVKLNIKLEGESAATAYIHKISNGTHIFETTATPPVALKDKRLVEALELAFKKHATTSALEPHQFDELLKIAKGFEVHFAGADAPFKHILEAEPFYKAYKDASVASTALQGKKDLAHELVREAINGSKGAHEKVIPESVLTGFRRSTAAFSVPEEFEAFKADVKQAQQFAERVSKIDFSKAEFDKSGTAAKKMEEILKDFYTKDRGLGNLKDFLPAEADKLLKKSELADMNSVISTFETGVSNAKTELTAIAAKIKSANLTIKTHSGIMGNASLREQATKDLEAAVEEGNLLLKESPGRYGAAYTDLDEGIKAMLKSKLSNAISTASKGVGSAANEAAKTGEAKWFSLNKGADDLAKLASEKGKAVEDLKFFEKLRPGKTAIVGLAAAGIGYLGVKAFASNDNSRSYAAREDARRSNPEASTARG